MDQVHLLGHVACGQVNLLSMRVGNGPREDLLPPTRLQPYSMATTLLTWLQPYSMATNLHGYSPTHMATALLTRQQPFLHGYSPTHKPGPGPPAAPRPALPASACLPLATPPRTLPPP